MLKISKPTLRLATSLFAVAILLVPQAGRAASMAQDQSGPSSISASQPGFTHDDPRDVNLAVRFIPRFSSSNISPIEGELTLTYAADGSVSGSFRQTLSGDSFALLGTADGKRLYFNVDAGVGTFHVDGTRYGQDGDAEMIGAARIGAMDYMFSAISCDAAQGANHLLCE